MKKSVIVFLLMGMVLLSGCAGSETIVTSGDEASEIVSDSVQQSSDSLSKAESSLSNYDDDVIFPSDFKKYESYVRSRSDWTYVDTDHLAKYAKLPAPSCIYGCSYGYGDDRGEAYTMDDYDCIVAYFCLIKSQGFEYEEAGKTSKATLYNVYDDDGDFVAGCMMSELRSDPVLFITSSE